MTAATTLMVRLLAGGAGLIPFSKTFPRLPWGLLLALRRHAIDIQLVDVTDNPGCTVNRQDGVIYYLARNYTDGGSITYEL